MPHHISRKPIHSLLMSLNQFPKRIDVSGQYLLNQYLIFIHPIFRTGIFRPTAGYTTLPSNGSVNSATIENEATLAGRSLLLCRTLIFGFRHSRAGGNPACDTGFPSHLETRQEVLN
jgi:hypothetical protein